MCGSVIRRTQGGLSLAHARSRTRAGLARAALTLGSLELRACLLAAAHEGLVPLVVAEDPAAFDGLLKAAQQRLEGLSWPGSDLHMSDTRFPGEHPPSLL